MIKVLEIRRLYSKKDPLHNWNHILRIKKQVKNLRKPYKTIDKKLLDFLINFHGLKDYAIKNKNNLEKDYIKSLLRSHKNPKKIEEKIVYDANMLDNVGKEGLKKAMAFGKKIGRNKKQTYDYLEKQLNKVRFYTKIGKKEGKIKIDVMKKGIR